MDGTTNLHTRLPVVNVTGVSLATAQESLQKLAETANVAAAVRAAVAATEVKPTEAQREAGNYRKGKVTIHGLVISVENPAGSFREGTDSDGHKWRTELRHHYGYFGGTKGKDGEHVDVFIGEQPESELAFVIDQVDPKTGEPDELKVMIGFTNEADAKAGYLDCYEKDWKGFGAIKAVTLADLKSRYLKVT